MICLSQQEHCFGNVELYTAEVFLISLDVAKLRGVKREPGFCQGMLEVVCRMWASVFLVP